jgi:predicted phage tail protein
MKRKKTDTVQLSKIRIREELRAKLAKDAERTARTLNGEIVARLEASYEMADRMARFREQWEARINDTRQFADAKSAETQAAREEMREAIEKAKQELREADEESQKQIEEVEREIEQAKTGIAIVDALLGDNEASRALIRQIVSQLMSNADWDSNKAARKAMAEKIHSYIYPKDIFEETKP